MKDKPTNQQTNKTMNTIEELTLKQLKEVLHAFGGTNNTTSTNEDDSHWEIGKNYFIRTVTHHLAGKLEKVTSKELVLSSAAWIADDGNFTEAMEANTFLEVEMFDPAEKVIVGRGSLIDAQKIHTLPTSRK